MKQFGLIVLCFCLKISLAQHPAKINLKDSCLMSGGIIEMKNLKKLCKICLPEAKKINSFIISYTENPPLYLELRCKGNRWDPSFLAKKAKPGLTFMIEEVNAIDHKGKPITFKPLIIGFK